MIELFGKTTVHVVNPEDEMDKISYGILMIIDIGITIHGKFNEPALMETVEEITTNIAGPMQWCDADMKLQDNAYCGRVRIFESIDGLLRFQDDRKKREELENG